MKASIHAVLLTFSVTLHTLVSGVASAAPPVERFDTSDTYYIFYGAWTTSLINTCIANDYRIVVCEPRNITRAQVETLQEGADGTLGTADDIRVLAYISLGEDNRIGVPFPYDPGDPDQNGFPGPRIDPRSNPAAPTDSIESTINNDGTATRGLKSPGVLNDNSNAIASYYVDMLTDANGNYDPTGSFDGVGEANGEFGGYFINAGDPAWFNVLKNMTAAGTGNAGLDEIFTTTVGKGLGCDGIFMDTIDTCAPNGFSPLTKFEWTAPGYRQLIKTIKETYPTKILLQNRGTFFFRTDVEHINFTVRPYVDAVFFESYFSDSNDFDSKSPFFNDNKFNVGYKMSVEADRADGFSVLSLGYLEPRAVRATITADGLTGDWSSEARLQVNGTTPATDAVQAVYASNDANNLYLRITTLPGTNLNTSNFNIYIDTDDDDDSGAVSTAGYVPTGAQERIKSELLYQWGGLYSQDTGVFNGGSVGSATVASNVAQSEWEIVIPRNITHPAGHARYPNQNVFGPDGSHILLITSFFNGTSTEFFPHEYLPPIEQNLGYRFEQAGPGSVYDQDFVESQEELGWLLYETDKFLTFAPNTRTFTWNSQNADTTAPVWSTTANGFVGPGATSTEPARVGVQEVIAGDSEVTVRWDLANDQTRPVRYKIYYAPTSPDPGTDVTGPEWSDTGFVAGETPSNYRFGTWSAGDSNGIYANEYTVTGLQNGTEYRFIVRASDSTPSPHEESNTVFLETTPQITGGSTWATITVDGAISDWPASAQIWGDPQSDNGIGASDIKAIWAANDSENIYIRIDAWNAHDFPNQFNNIYFDTDLNGADTTFNPFGASLIASELLMSGAGLFSQKDGNFNDGFIQNAPSYVPIGSSTATSWEFIIPRDLQHPAGVGGGDVFTSTGFDILVTSGSSTSDELAGVASYTFANPSVFTTITVDGTITDWPASSLVYTDASGDNGGAPADIAAIYMANDASYFYMRVDTHNSNNLTASSSNNFYFDTDFEVAPGFNPHSLGAISSKMLVQGDSIYSQGNGGFNDGTISTAAISPFNVTATSWEYRFPLTLTHPGTAGVRANQDVFPAIGSTIGILLTSDNSGAAELAPDSGQIQYVLAGPTITQHSTNATITVDGSTGDWPAGALVWSDAQSDNAGAASDIQSVYLANDADYIYLRIDTWNSHNYLGAFNNTYFDTDTDIGTGFAPHGLFFGSELMLQNSGVFSQKNGGFNEGAATSPSSKTVSVSPGSGTATSWEWRIPRDLQHPSGGGNVFGLSDGSFFFFATSDNAGFAEGAPDNPANSIIHYIPAP